MSAPELSQVLAQRWFQKAENDLLNVENNLKAERYPADTVCFHCQQAAEKYLKGFLAWHQTPFAKIHDLLELQKQVAQIARDTRGAGLGPSCSRVRGIDYSSPPPTSRLTAWSTSSTG